MGNYDEWNYFFAYHDIYLFIYTSNYSSFYNSYYYESILIYYYYFCRRMYQLYSHANYHNQLPIHIFFSRCGVRCEDFQNSHLPPKIN